MNTPEAIPQWTPSPILVDDSTNDRSSPVQAATNSANVPDVQSLRSPLEITKTAYELIVDPSHWIKHALAIDEGGNPCPPESERAQAWCTIGSFQAVLAHEPADQRTYMEKYLVSLWNAANPAAMLAQHSVERVNDTHDHEFVVRCFERLMRFLSNHPEADDPYPNRQTRRTAVRTAGHRAS